MVMINRKKHTEKHVKHYWMIDHNPSSALQFHYSIAKTYKGVFVCFVLTTTIFFLLQASDRVVSHQTTFDLGCGTDSSCSVAQHSCLQKGGEKTVNALQIKTLLWQFLLNEKQSGKVAGVDRFRTSS